MQLENVNKEEENEIPEDSHVLHFWQPCKFEITDDLIMLMTTFYLTHFQIYYT